MGKIPLVYLDYGHYRGISGHKSPDGKIEEWETVRTIGRWVKQKLEQVGVKVVETHPEDKMLVSNSHDLKTRWSRANVYYAKDKKNYECIFVSLHTDAASNGSKSSWHSASGCTVHISTNASEKSKRLANAYNNLFRQFDLLGNRVGAIRRNNFAVLVNTKMPAVLIENLFITNINDCKILQDKSSESPLVLANFSAILDYFLSLDTDFVWGTKQ